MFFICAATALRVVADNKAPEQTYDNLCIVSYVDPTDAQLIESTLRVTPIFNLYIAPMNSDHYHVTIKRCEGDMKNRHLSVLKILRHALAKHTYTCSEFKLGLFATGGNKPEEISLDKLYGTIKEGKPINFDHVNIVLMLKKIIGKKDGEEKSLEEIRKEAISEINETKDNEYSRCFFGLESSFSFIPHVTLAQYFPKGRNIIWNNKVSQQFDSQAKAAKYIQDLESSVQNLKTIALLPPVIKRKKSDGMFEQLVPAPLKPPKVIVI